MPTALVVGGGVSGLSTGIKLQKSGWKVTIVSSDFHPNTTSDAAAAFWMPYKLSDTRLDRWSRETYEELLVQCNTPETGARLVRVVVLLGKKNPESYTAKHVTAYPCQHHHSPSHTSRHDDAFWWTAYVKDVKDLSKNEVPEAYTSGFSFVTPIIETPLAMKWLMKVFGDGGGVLLRDTIDSIQKLKAISGSYDVIVNCTGLASRDLFKDTLVYPIRGQILVVKAPYLDPNTLYCDEDELAYIVPRKDGVILGGTAQEYNWNTTPDPQTATEILDKCTKVLPALSQVKLPQDTVKQYAALRPGRHGPLRLEVDLHCLGAGSPPVIHNYGHGGSGWTTNWGCANEVRDLANAIYHGRSARVQGLQPKL